MYCGTCGKALPDGAKFCDQCGAIQPDLTPECQKPKAEPAVLQPVLPKEKPQKNKTPKKKVNKKLLAIVAAVLVVAVVAAIVIPIFFPGKQTIYVCVKEIWYTSDGIAYMRFDYEYDEMGNLLSCECDKGTTTTCVETIPDGTGTTVYSYYSGDYDGIVDWVDEYAYDEYGNPTRMEEHRNGTHSIKYEYDENARVERYTVKREATELETAPATYECQYDDDGNLLCVYILRKAQYDVEDFLIQAYEYDKEGRLEISYYSIRECTYRNEFIYKNDRLCRIDWYTGVTSFFQSGEDPNFKFKGSIEYEYDKDGHLIEEITLDENGDEISCIEYEYDDDGFLEEKKETSSDGDDIKIQYTCDKHGNIIEEEWESGIRVEYEYEELEVTKQQAAYFRRRAGYWNYKGNYDHRSLIIYYLIPDPRWD